MLDLAVVNGRVVTPSGVGDWDIWVKGQRIVALVVPGGATAPSRRVIDATGRIVLPGGIEAHAHIGIPGARPTWYAKNAGIGEQSRAAIFGGTTTLLDFAVVTRQSRQGSTPDVLAELEGHLEALRGRSYADYSAHCVYRGDVSDSEIHQMDDLISAGFPSFKVFTVGPPLRERHVPAPGTRWNRARDAVMVGVGPLLAMMEQSASSGGIMAIHAEDNELVRHNYESARIRGIWGFEHLPAIRSSLSEQLAMRRAIQLAGHAGAATYFVHVSSKEGVDVAAEARARGAPAYAETILPYLSFTSEDYKRPHGQIYHTYPSLKSSDDRQRLWDGLLRGDVSVLATDSVVTSLAGKTVGKTIADVQGGNVGIELRMALAFSEAVVKRGMSLERYAAVTSTNPAKILGLYPRKGAIAVGSDADLTVIDPTVVKKIQASDLHLSDYSPWEGWDVLGWPTSTVLRGKVVVDRGELTGLPTDGRLIWRKIDRSVLQTVGV